MSSTDVLIGALDLALRTLSQSAHAARPMPIPIPMPAPVRSAAAAALVKQPEALTSDERRLSGALMRVNHVGEVCAQALYSAQAMGTSKPELSAQLQHAALACLCPWLALSTAPGRIPRQRG